MAVVQFSRQTRWDKNREMISKSLYGHFMVMLRYDIMLGYGPSWPCDLQKSLATNKKKMVIPMTSKNSLIASCLTHATICNCLAIGWLWQFWVFTAAANMPWAICDWGFSSVPGLYLVVPLSGKFAVSKPQPAHDWRMTDGCNVNTKVPDGVHRPNISLPALWSVSSVKCALTVMSQTNLSRIYLF